MLAKSHLIGKNFYVHLRREAKPTQEKEAVEVLGAEHGMLRLCFFERKETLISWIPMHEIIALDEAEVYPDDTGE